MKNAFKGHEKTWKKDFGEWSPQRILLESLVRYAEMNYEPNLKEQILNWLPNAFKELKQKPAIREEQLCG
jgi:hypothetical protein